MPSAVTLEVTKGDYEPLIGTVTDAAGAPSQIQGSILYFGIKKYEADTDHIVLKSSVDPTEIQILDDGTEEKRGQYVIYNLPQDLDSQKAGLFVYGIRVVMSPEIRRTPVYGTLILNEDLVDEV